MKVAIIHPRFAVLGGGEKVIEELALLYPMADIFVLFNTPEMVPLSLKDHRIYPSFLNRVPWIKKTDDKLALLYPLAIESMDVSEYDLVISSAGPATFGVNVSQDTVHICYCHSPARTWWDKYAQRQQGLSFSRKLFYTARASYIRSWEFGAAQRVFDHFVANSRYISRRVRKYLCRESTVIYPPVNTSSAYIAESHGEYFLTVGRLMSAKKVDILIEACNLLGKKLLVVGTGFEEARLKSLAGPTIEFLGYVPDVDLPEIYANCRALLFAADEDFGIVPVEAQSFGRPVIAYGYGGSLETVRVGDPDGRSDTGVFFAEQTVEGVIGGIVRFEEQEAKFNAAEIQGHARQFDTSVFLSRMREFVDSAMVKR